MNFIEQRKRIGLQRWLNSGGGGGGIPPNAVLEPDGSTALKEPDNSYVLEP